MENTEKITNVERLPGLIIEKQRLEAKLTDITGAFAAMCRDLKEKKDADGKSVKDIIADLKAEIEKHEKSIREAAESPGQLYFL